MPKNVFISHYHKNDPELQRLKERFAEKGYIIRNGSIDKSKVERKKLPESVVRRLLRMRINWAGTFICLIGPRTHTRDWVNYEVEQAYRMGKPMIGIFTHGASDADLPDNFDKYGGQLFGWNSMDKIIETIDNVKQFDWENPDGTKRPIKNKVKSVSC